MEKFNEIVYRVPGRSAGPDGKTYDWVGVKSKAEFNQRLEEGWFNTLNEAIKGKKESSTVDVPDKNVASMYKVETPEEVALRIARVAHEVNRGYCEALEDDSQPLWDNAPDWQKDSAVNGVNFHIANPDAGPEHSHNEWLKEKEEAGWKYGEVKDPEKKEHPCFVPYEELPVEQKAKDYIFRSIVHALSCPSGERAREEDGTFKGDDPSTPDVNEAYKDGKKPNERDELKKKATDLGIEFPKNIKNSKLKKLIADKGK